MSANREVVAWRPAPAPLRLIAVVRMRQKIARPRTRLVMVAGYCARCREPFTVRMRLSEIPASELRTCRRYCADRLRAARRLRRAGWELVLATEPEPLRRLVALALLCADGMDAVRVNIALRGCIGKHRLLPQLAREHAQRLSQSPDCKRPVVDYECALCGSCHVGGVRGQPGRFEGAAEELWAHVRAAARAEQFRLALSAVIIRPPAQELTNMINQSGHG